MLSAKRREVCSLVLFALCACTSSAPEATHETLGLESASFARGGVIPEKYTCHGSNTSPALSWATPPAQTASLALVVIDRDSPLQLVFGPFVHWIVYNLPARTRQLPESTPKAAALPNGTLQGRNSAGESAYHGPCPPGNASHRYVFALYALDTKLNLPPGVTLKRLEAAMRGHVLAEGRTSAHYR